MVFVRIFCSFHSFPVKVNCFPPSRLIRSSPIIVFVVICACFINLFFVFHTNKALYYGDVKETTTMTEIYDDFMPAPFHCSFGLLIVWLNEYALMQRVMQRKLEAPSG